MLPAPQYMLQAPGHRLRGTLSASALMALGILALPQSLSAQDGAAPSVPDELRAAPAIPGAELTTTDGRTIAFEADELAFDSERDVVTASGDVILQRGDQSVRANTVRWDRQSGVIMATGNVRFVDQDGNQLFTESLELTDELKAGAMQDLLLAMREGGRLAARSGIRDQDGSVQLTDAAYSACAVQDKNGCAKAPSWRITADRVNYDPDSNRIRFTGAYLEIFGARLLPLPGLSVRTDGRAVSGLTVPGLRISESNGVEINGGYYFKLADNRDLELGARIFTDTAPLLEGTYRELSDNGALQITGYATRSQTRSQISGLEEGNAEFRGYLGVNSKFQFNPEWSLTTSARFASDRTFLRRYDISRDDRLRNMIDLERIDDQSYLSIAGWATQTLRAGDPQSSEPIALPLIDYRRRLSDPLLGGRVELQANSLNIVRPEGQDTQRAFAGARWDMRRLTSGGQEVTFTALARGDVYHSNDNARTQTAIYAGNEGWEHRLIGLGAIDVKWPFVGEAFGGTQVFTPRLQLIASPQIKNLAIPNEDARAVDLEDSNLFALNRFPGYDRVEDGVRLTYGLDWQLTRPGLRIKTTVGQSYRLNDVRELLPDGTGLSDRVSDFVGRTEVRYNDFVSLTHRFRLDKDNLAVRRNEFDLTVGSRKTYLELGYLRLNRDIDNFEDLQDREELRAAGRVKFARFFSVFGSAIVNLTDREEDPSFTSDGFEPLRTRLGVAYNDDCLEMGLTWRRDYAELGDARRGNTFQIFFALNNLGVR
ncbi:LPS-assembly protein LptD [Altererythrobacter aquiaggeris]|uniref:LPS-assembly protein LptD n=1 Tax=Aestuarierythrobacter aquiaggeris TaxID=1898396 RepID=UPI0030162B87